MRVSIQKVEAVMKPALRVPVARFYACVPKAVSPAIAMKAKWSLRVLANLDKSCVLSAVAAEPLTNWFGVWINSCQRRLQEGRFKSITGIVFRPKRPFMASLA